MGLVTILGLALLLCIVLCIVQGWLCRYLATRLDKTEHALLHLGCLHEQALRMLAKARQSDPADWWKGEQP